MEYYDRFVKLQKYYLGQPVEPAIYKKGDYISSGEYEDLDDCMYDYIWKETDEYICVVNSSGISKYKALQAYIDDNTPVEPAIYKRGELVATGCEQEDCNGPRQQRIVDFENGTIITSKSDDCGNTWVVTETSDFIVKTGCFGCKIWQGPTNNTQNGYFYNNYRFVPVLSDDEENLYVARLGNSSTGFVIYKCEDGVPTTLVAQTTNTSITDDESRTYWLRTASNNQCMSYYDTTNNIFYAASNSSMSVNSVDGSRYINMLGDVVIWNINTDTLSYHRVITDLSGSAVTGSLGYVPNPNFVCLRNGFLLAGSVGQVVYAVSYDYDGNKLNAWSYSASDGTTCNSNTRERSILFEMKSKKMFWADGTNEYSIDLNNLTDLTPQKTPVMKEQVGSITYNFSCFWKGLWCYGWKPYDRANDSVSGGYESAFKYDLSEALICDFDVHDSVQTASDSKDRLVIWLWNNLLIVYEGGSSTSNKYYTVYNLTCSE